MMTEDERHSHVSGSGPGAITPDGCSVELWASLPAGDMPAVVDGAIPRNASVLDLGAGAGRLTHPLLDLGHRVVAVDESAEMLSRISGAATVCASIEGLRLGETFDAVLLASHLVNVPAREARTALLATVRAHLREGGQGIIQRFTPGWAAAVDGSVAVDAGITTRLRVMEVADNGVVTMDATYTMSGRTWQQVYSMQELDDAMLSASLGEVGLCLERWLTDDGRWVVVTVRSPRPG